MAFDTQTRNRLARFVAESRGLLTTEFDGQLQESFGIYAAEGRVLDLATLSHLDESGRATAALLRERIDYLVRTHPDDRGGVSSAITRLAREQAFTVLNRLAAIRMAEKRDLLVESVGQGYQSKGLKVYETVAGSGLGDAYHRYRRYLFCLFDELAVDLGVLFDRHSPQGLLFPREPAFLALLAALNASDLATLWAEDETIGWIYQYYNDPAERKKMREESSAPRNSRELAVRNQFFTPRYVVEFLTDNTLGRIWYEMTQGQTVLKERCRYLVRRPAEIFLKAGEIAPPAPETEGLSQEQLLKQPVHIAYRLLKDPRELRMLDPACGSMHFGLYAFDLFEVIYDEAWDLGIESLRRDFPDKAALLRQVPQLVIEHNIHGIDIDPRAAQIAALSLWLRAQKSWHQQKVGAADRPRITRSNVVCAEPMPGDKTQLREFVDASFPAAERPVFQHLLERVFDHMQLAGEAGSLLKIEEEIRTAIDEAKALWEKSRATPRELFSTEVINTTLRPGTQQELGGLDTAVGQLPATGDFWATAEDRIYTALRAYAGQAESGVQRRLFAEDAARGFAFIDVCRKRYDVALMNPPFGLPTAAVEEYAKERYESTWQDIYASFYERTLGFTKVDFGYIGAITPKSFYHAKGFRGLRNLLKAAARLYYSIDIGGGVLDAAVEVCFSIVQSRRSCADSMALFCNLVSCEKSTLAGKVLGFVNHVNIGEASPVVVPVAVGKNVGLPNEMLPYRFPADLLKLLQTSPSFEASSGSSVVGITTFDNDRFIRLSWETTESSRHAKQWLPVAMGGGWNPFYAEFNLVVKWAHDAAEMRANEIQRYDTTARTMQSQRFWFRPGLTFSKISTLGFSTQPFPAGSIFTSVGFCIFSDTFDNWAWLGYFNSKPVCCLMSLFSADRHWHSNSVAFLPVPAGMSSNVAKLSKEAFAISVQLLGQSSETAPEFLRCDIDVDVDEKAAAYQKLTQDLASEISASFCLSASTIEFLASNAIYAERDFSVSSEELAERRLSYFLGCAFGRWDVRYATGERATPELPDPFAPLPVCPPGMLQNAAGLPTTPADVPASYPVSIPWDGILVDDPNHPADIECRVRAVIELIWKDKTEAIEREACEILDVPSLRDYFRKPSGFFADHLKRYSKSRRQAPIYWPLSTASGNYTLWIYYHRLTDQTLFQCVNDFVKPKICEVEADLGREASRGNPDRDTRAEIERLTAFRSELVEFRDELLRVAQLPYQPNLNDGVLITAAPLWKFFRLPKWQKDLKACWQELEKGDYDWAHLALSIWPARVRKVCENDRSIAIAHGLEHLCKVKPAAAKAKKGRKKSAAELELDGESE